jgi:hypothetical protein
MNQPQKGEITMNRGEIIETIFAICVGIFVIFLLSGSAIYFSNEIQDASWDKITFYSCLLLLIAFKFQYWFFYPLDVILQKRYRFQ